MENTIYSFTPLLTLNCYVIGLYSKYLIPPSNKFTDQNRLFSINCSFRKEIRAMAKPSKQDNAQTSIFFSLEIFKLSFFAFDMKYPRSFWCNIPLPASLQSPVSILQREANNNRNNGLLVFRLTSITENLYKGIFTWIAFHFAFLQTRPNDSGSSLVIWQLSITSKQELHNLPLRNRLPKILRDELKEVETRSRVSSSISSSRNLNCATVCPGLDLTASIRGKAH